MAVEVTKFLGATVISANSQMSWGGDSGACSLSLVEDTINGDKFLPPKLGTACMFKFGAFEFGGILQRWTFKESVDQGRTYEVVLESPAKVLDGVFVILGLWQGSIYTDDTNVDTPYNKPVMTYGGKYPTNLINLFAMKENFSYGGKFGKADLTELGYPVKTIIADLKQAMGGGSTTTSTTGGTGGAIGAGGAKGASAASGFGGKIKYGASEYDLDLTELGLFIEQIPDYRLSGDMFDLNSLIKNIADMAIGDYIITLTGGTSSGVIAKPVIKIKTKLRKEDPAPDIIKEKIAAYLALPDASKILSSYSIGKELSDSVTQKVLLGAQASRTWVADRRVIYPIWGWKGIGENTQYFYGDSIDDYFDPFAKIRITVDGGYEGNFTTVDTELLEIRCAHSGRETWSVYHMFKAIKEGKPAIGLGKLKFTKEDYEKLLLGELAPNDLYDTEMKNAEIIASYLYTAWDGARPGGWVDVQKIQLQRIANARFKAVETIAQKFYGRTFLIAMPLEAGGKENNYRWIKDDYREEFSWEVGDAAWPGDDIVTNVITDKKFYNSQGALPALAFYEEFNNVDFSGLGSEYGRVTWKWKEGNKNKSAQTVISRIDTNPDGFGMKFLDEKFVNINKKEPKTDSAGSALPPITDAKNQLVFVAVQINNPVFVWDELTTQYNGFGKLAKLMLGKNYLGYHNMFGFNHVDIPISPAPHIPGLISVPQVSNRYVWGPWFSIGADNGKCVVMTDPLFSPQSFGSIKDMNEQAETYVKAEVAKVYESESGYVEVAEKPQFNLADKFMGSGPYITSISMTMSVGGITTTYAFATWTKRGASLAKYNVDRIAGSQRKNFEHLKKIRDLYRNPPGIPVRPPERRDSKQLRNTTPAVNGIFGNFMNAAARQINNGWDVTQAGYYPGINMHGMSLDAAKEPIGLNNRESFGGTMEQYYSMGFLYNQRDPNKAKTDFNA